VFFRSGVNTRQHQYFHYLRRSNEKQKKNDWMTTDALIACPDPNRGSMLKIIRTDIRTFSHAETTVVGLEGNAGASRLDESGI